jgi:hypothetical protein
MTQQYTVIWRPISEDEFRLDHVEAEPDQTQIMRAAAQVFIDEYADDDETESVDDVLSDYEMLFIFDGHLIDAALGA